MSDKNRPWGVHTVYDMFGNINKVAMGASDGRFVVAVPEPYTGNKFVAAWWVLTGRAYAVVWPKPGELEAAIGAPVPKEKRAS